eukprot:1469081-Pleurochrysis_carterae.AAC.1
MAWSEHRVASAVGSPVRRPPQRAGHPCSRSRRERSAKNATDRTCTRCRKVEASGRQCWRGRRRQPPSVPVARRPLRGP